MSNFKATRGGYDITTAVVKEIAQSIESLFEYRDYDGINGVAKVTIEWTSGGPPTVYTPTVYTPDPKPKDAWVFYNEQTRRFSGRVFASKPTVLDREREEGWMVVNIGGCHEAT